MDFECELCERVVYVARFGEATRCLTCEAEEEQSDHMSVEKLRLNSDEMGRAITPSLEE